MWHTNSCWESQGKNICKHNEYCAKAVKSMQPGPCKNIDSFISSISCFGPGGTSGVVGESSEDIITLNSINCLKFSTWRSNLGPHLSAFELSSQRGDNEEAEERCWPGVENRQWDTLSCAITGDLLMNFSCPQPVRTWEAWQISSTGVMVTLCKCHWIISQSMF